MAFGRPVVLRVGAGGEKCGELLCTTLGKGAQAAPVASVSGGLIAIRKPGAVAVLDEHGTLVRFFSFAPADVNAALLDGGRLVVWRFGVLEVYDVATGAGGMQRPLPIAEEWPPAAEGSLSGKQRERKEAPLEQERAVRSELQTAARQLA